MRLCCLILLLPLAACECSRRCPEGTFASEGYCAHVDAAALDSSAPDAAADTGLEAPDADADVPDADAAPVDSEPPVDSSARDADADADADVPDADAAVECFSTTGPGEGQPCADGTPCPPPCDPGYGVACLNRFGPGDARCVYMPCSVESQAFLSEGCLMGPCPEMCGAPGSCRPSIPSACVFAP